MKSAAFSRDLPRITFHRARRLETVLQTEAAECGLACVAMVAGYHGYRVGLTQLRRRFSISQKGGNLTALMRTSAELGLAGRAVKLDLPALEALKTPCILHWEFNHFVVLERVSSGLAYIHDPAQGFRRVRMEEVSRKFTGVALELWPTDTFEKRDTYEKVSLSRLVGSLRGLRGAFLQILVFSVSLEVFVLAAPFYVQWTVDHALASADLDLVSLLAMSFGVLVVCQNLTSALRSWLLMHVSMLWNMRWRSDMFSHLIRLPLDFFIRRHLGDLLSKFGAVDEIQRTFTTSFLEGTLDGAMTLLTLGLMVCYSPRLAAIVALTAVVCCCVRALWFKPLRAAASEHLIHAAKQDSHFLETLRGMRAIKLFSREEGRRQAWLALMVDQLNADTRVRRLTLLHRHCNALVCGLENIAVVWLGAIYVIDGALSVGALMAFIAYKTLFQSRISGLTEKVAEFRMLTVQADRLADIALAEEERVDDGFSADLIEPIEPYRAAQVDVAGLSFRYDRSEPWVLHDVSFTIYPGESVAITGESGCGKSTLAHVLLGILAPTAGTVILRESGAQHRGAGSLRRAFGTVMQDDMLLAGSLFDNISFFDSQADPAWVIACAKMACIHDEIEALLMRYDTLAGDMGSALSGGQKQRVLLARALYKKPACLLLDEATSHLDVDCERRVNAAIRALKMTRIIIAHRPETIASADRVLRLQGGRLIPAE
ncbi:peptidase domain-containing ABC transporter [Bordetella sp. 15P40C-2]|uniref:peptidase domain-containing ABC transporter n=1 Tax=Bordetella sp. 15P40C-2 TaxID=2572246 RepID=UPI001924C128